MLKLVIVVGTRPEIIRLSSTIKQAIKVFDVILVHTGQNYDFNLNDVFFRDLALPTPQYYLNCARDNVGAAVGDIITKSYNLLVELKPDAILILGDTNSCLCAYSAKRLKIPIFHIEAGNRCFDPNVPEEINRRIIDHISDINMCYMEHARRNLLQEGLKPQSTFVLGSPMREVLNSIAPAISQSKILSTLNLQPYTYFMLSMHREENLDNPSKFQSAMDCVQQLATTYNKKIIFSVHPRTRKVLVERNIQFPDNVILSAPFGLIDYCCLQQCAMCVISDSGTLTEESAILDFPAVLLRDSTEHPEGIDSGNMVIGDIHWDHLKTSLHLALTQEHRGLEPAYQDTNFSNKVCNIISGYVGIVNKFLWMK